MCASNKRYFGSCEQQNRLNREKEVDEAKPQETTKIEAKREASF